jgi:hypothetical protein
MPAVPPRQGLIPALGTFDGVEDTDWVAGFTWLPEGPGTGGGAEPITCMGNTGTLAPDAPPGAATADTIAVWAADQCAPQGALSRDWQGRATRQLRAQESFHLAAELWDGGVAQVIEAQEGLAEPATRYLAGPDTWSDRVTESGAASALNGLACLEAGLASALSGARGLIHVTPQVLVHLVGANLVHRDGQQLVSPNGHLVVADAGYTGTGPVGEPAGDTQWGYATDMMRVLLGPVQVLPNSLQSARDYAEGLNRATNLVTVYAMRVAAYQWAGNAHLAAEFDIPVCGIGGS